MKNFFIVLLISMSLLLGCANLFEEMSDKTTDKSRLYQAQLALGKGDWDGAITAINLMTTTYQAKREVVTMKASAYAGKCGLDFIDLVNRLQNAGTSTLMGVFLAAYTGKTTSNLAHCLTAETLLKSIGTHLTRTVDENLLMAFVSATKIGVILNSLGDTNADGTADAAWDPCDAGDGATDLPDDASATNSADATEVVTGVGNFLTSLTAAGAGDSAGDLFDDLNSTCAAAGAVCSVVNRADVTVAHRRGVRSMIIENTDGLGLSIQACDTATCLATVCAAIGI